KRLRAVEIPENFYLLRKVGYQHLKNVIVYDAWWRLMRNLEIRRAEDIPASGYPGPVPAVIYSMVKWQRRIPLPWLRIGPLSKFLMVLHFILHRKSIPS
ncbi:MAG TPA: hypothetical protein VN616_06680, partial [Puia sp.]|nr:hypothetical protein [Puia sp.]